MKRLKLKLIIFYYKWIKRECPHFCYFCEHINNKYQCEDEIITYYKLKKGSK